MEPTLRSQVANKSPFVDLGQECADNRPELLAQEWEERGRQSHICSNLGQYLETVRDRGHENKFSKLFQQNLFEDYQQLPLQIFRDSFLPAIRLQGRFRGTDHMTVLRAIQALQEADDDTIHGFMQAGDLLYDAREMWKLKEDVLSERPDLVSALKRHDMHTLEREIITLCNDLTPPSQEDR
jgi:hypothetical protein